MSDVKAERGEPCEIMIPQSRREWHLIEAVRQAGGGWQAHDSIGMKSMRAAAEVLMALDGWTPDEALDADVVVRLSEVASRTKTVLAAPPPERSPKRHDNDTAKAHPTRQMSQLGRAALSPLN